MSGVQFQQGYLKGVAKSSTHPEDLVPGKYDVLLMTSSWDRRCIPLTHITNINATIGMLLLFSKKDSHGLREKHDAIVSSYCKRVSGTFVTIFGDSLETKNLWETLRNNLINAHRAIGRPMSVLVDISTCPKFYSMAILACCFKERLAHRVTLFYSEGEYRSAANETEPVFTRGEWKAVTVPYMDGTWSPEKQKFFLISCGFEGPQTFRVALKADPERISLLYPDPGVVPAHTMKTEDSNRELRDYYKIPDEQIVRAHAADAIETWKNLEDNPLEDPESENVHYVACGTKPHAIALVLRALAKDYPTVLYSVPDEHVVHDTYPRGTYWTYQLDDLTSFPPVAGKHTSTVHRSLKNYVSSILGKDISTTLKKYFSK